MIDIDALLESDGLYITTMPDGRSYTYRLLGLKEYRVFRGLRESGAISRLLLHDKVFERCYIGNSDMIDGDTPAGYTISIGELIMWLSGDGAAIGDKEDLETARMMYPADTVYEYMRRTCLRAFPSYKIEDVDKWTRPLLLQRFVLAECILTEASADVREGSPGYQPIELKHIMSAEQKAKTERRQNNPQGIDFARENAAVNQAMSGGEGHDPLDLPPDQFQRKMKIARKMDGRQTRGR
jgi:hypothetical protein